jgi:hypothetical protein
VGQGTAAVNEGSDATPGIDNEHENEHEHDSGDGTTHLDRFLSAGPIDDCPPALSRDRGRSRRVDVRADRLTRNAQTG